MIGDARLPEDDIRGKCMRCVFSRSAFESRKYDMREDFIVLPEKAIDDKVCVGVARSFLSD